MTFCSSLSAVAEEEDDEEDADDDGLDDANDEEAAPAAFEDDEQGAADGGTKAFCGRESRIPPNFFPFLLGPKWSWASRGGTDFPCSFTVCRAP